MNTELREAFISEVLRINLRYTMEVIEAFNLCPFAKHGRLSGKTEREVILQKNRDIQPTLSYIDYLEREKTDLEVIQLIYPLLVVTPQQFERFNSDIRETRRKSPKEVIFVHATFHPQYPYEPRTPDTLVAFFRRAPDPTIQLVRWSVLQTFKKNKAPDKYVIDPTKFDFTKPFVPPVVPESVSDRIARENHELVLNQGPETLAQIIQSIQEDRTNSYRSFLDDISKIID